MAAWYFGKHVLEYEMAHYLNEPLWCRSNEKASDVYTTELLTKILKEEGGTLFDARSASLGHTLQGGIPSPMDRSRAVRLSMKCMIFLEEQAKKINASKDKSRKAIKESAAVITILRSSVAFAPVEALVEVADMKNRRGLNPWWANIKDLTETLGGKYVPVSEFTI